jgi:hypothetical protein
MQSPAPISRQARHRRAVWFALGAMLVYCLAPLLPPPAAAASLVQICTVHGIVTIAVPDSDAPAHAGAMPDCLACALTVHAGLASHAVLPAKAWVPVAVPVTMAHAAIVERPGAGLFLAGARPRAPPFPV